MKLTLWNIGKVLNLYKNKAVGITIAYSSGVIINLITEADSMSELLTICLDWNRPAILVMWVMVIVSILMLVLASIIASINRSQSPSAVFQKIMLMHTAPELNAFGRNDLSWGYNKNIHRSKDPMGWLPEAFAVASYVDNREFEYPIKNESLPDYTRKEYALFLESEKAKECIAKRNNEDRFAAMRIEPNFNKKEQKVSISLLRTDWLSLQFSWNYMRLLDGKNEPIVNKSHLGAVQQAIGRVFMDSEQSNDYLINSLCLHLILETSDGKAVLARISQNKKNDYPSTWAATLGEQIERRDFYDEKENRMLPDFVQRWTKRAFEEELRISDKDREERESELEEYVDMKSLRVLSVDFEGDIYNIALTAVVRLKMCIQQLVEHKSLWIDREEATEFIAVDEKQIRDILLHYPSNRHAYHPSSYLRLLMFHLYKTGTNELCRAFCEDYKALREK